MVNSDEAILAALARIEATVVRIEEGMTGGGRDAADLDLLEVLFAEMGDAPFLCRQVMARARQPSSQEALRDALEMAQITSAKSLGWVLLRMSKNVTGAIEVLRLTDRRAGAVWQLRARVLRVCFEKPA